MQITRVLQTIVLFLETETMRSESSTAAPDHLKPALDFGLVQMGARLQKGVEEHSQ